MKNYHTIVLVEKRISTDAQPRQLARSISSGATSTLVNGVPGIDTSMQVTQLHSFGESLTNLANPNLIYCAEWDGVAGHVTVLKGTMVGLNMHFAGWPTTDKPTPTPVILA